MFGPPLLPLGLEDEKFSSASDVWSFGITCIEILQDGLNPYPEIRSNPTLMTMVAAGEVHPQPPGCSGEVYAVLLQCWQLSPSFRTTFADLARKFAQLAARGNDNDNRRVLFANVPPCPSPPSPPTCFFL